MELTTFFDIKTVQPNLPTDGLYGAALYWYAIFVPNIRRVQLLQELCFLTIQIQENHSGKV